MNKTIAAILGILVVGGLVWWLVAKNNDDVAGNDNNDDNIACTMDAKLCPDGSYVGREGPNCEFRACPGDSTDADEPVFDKG